MKKRALILIAVLFVGAFAPFSETLDEVHAARGCCMQRSGNEWYPNGMNFNQCSQANRNRDGMDNLYEPSGSIWWNVNC